MDVETIPLMRCLQTLHMLWTEYQFGVGGKKPAKLFTARERGEVKFLYSLRKPFWTLVGRTICFGYSRTNAIKKLKAFIVQGDQRV